MLKCQCSIAFDFQTSHYSALLVRISVKLISFFICIKFFIQLLIEWNVHTSNFRWTFPSSKKRFAACGSTNDVFHKWKVIGQETTLLLAWKLANRHFYFQDAGKVWGRWFNQFIDLSQQTMTLFSGAVIQRGYFPST